jgi:hypothetical protein
LKDQKFKLKNNVSFADIIVEDESIINLGDLRTIRSNNSDNKSEHIAPAKEDIINII